MKKEYWNTVLTAGLVLGVLYAAAGFLTYATYGNSAMGWIISVLGFAVIAWSLYYYGKKVAVITDVDGMGFSYGKAVGFSIMVLLLSGVITGISQWLLQNVIDPEFYAQIHREALENVIKLMPSATDEQIAASKKSLDMMHQIWYVIGASMLSMVLLGGLVALITSVFVQRKPRVF